jgi:hypothetical protein
MAVPYEGKETELMLNEKGIKPDPRGDAKLYTVLLMCHTLTMLQGIT